MKQPARLRMMKPRGGSEKLGLGFVDVTEKGLRKMKGRYVFI